MPASTILRSAVDTEFRDELVHSYGVSADSLPAAVEQPDQESLDFWTEGVAAMEIYACRNSCSFGPLTIVCDGDTK
ncbi:cinnamycin family lantibiotic [Actinomadura rubrisoli]|uniref:Cinnamycin family lantibiotic n=1 Tax=Actinomadura rubrisoli TaxID=2530368 RepID=A0A4R5BT78_9ACTN|nr:cinnamycin family lantibiotic [Actinomadura rubrisoli]TDD89275.1 cinnamycin family lantibiotic [Actinomadura rubrisoli]